MLGEAKHLEYLVQNTQTEILRRAQDASSGGFFRSLLEPERHDVSDWQRANQTEELKPKAGKDKLQSWPSPSEVVFAITNLS